MTGTGQKENSSKTRDALRAMVEDLGYLTSYEYAERHGIKESTVRKWIRYGKLEAVQIGTGWWVREDEPVPPNISKMKAGEKKAFMETEGRRLTGAWHSENGSGWKKNRHKEGAE